MANATLHTLDIHSTSPIIRPLEAASLAVQLTNVVEIEGADYRIPMITDDPSAAWLGEGDEIPKSEAAADEVLITPRKLAALSVISTELADDTSPEAKDEVMLGIGRDMAGKIDLAFFGAEPAPGSDQPGGLESVDGISTIVAAPTGLDPFIDALAAAESTGATIRAWVTTPAVAAALAKLKAGTGNNLPLFGTGATNGIQRQVLGIPLLVSKHVLTGTVWGIPEARAYTVLRQDVRFVVDASRYLEYDQVAIRAIMRIGFGFPQPNTLVKIKASA